MSKIAQVTCRCVVSDVSDRKPGLVQTDGVGDEFIAVFLCVDTFIQRNGENI